MKIVIAPDSFKGSLSALEVANAIEAGFSGAFPEANFVKIPVADGGEGTMQALVDATGGRIITEEVTGPLFEKVRAQYGILGDEKTAVIEMAQAAGLPLVPPDRRNPMETTTRGVGELILSALEMGVKRFIVGIGGSATVDGGIGMLSALGVKFPSSSKEEVPPCGKGLTEIEKIDLSSLDPRVSQSEFVIACDVQNPLLGVEGAARVYGPQKGASEQQVALLESGLGKYADAMQEVLGKDVRDLFGGGASGGLGAAFAAFCQAELVSGVDLVTEELCLEERLEGASLVITGDGGINDQTIKGKAPLGVARIAKKHQLPVIAFVGDKACDVDVIRTHGIEAVFSIAPGPTSMEDSCKNARQYLVEAAKNVATALTIGKGL